MLSFETPHLEADRVILLPDHEDPLLCHYSAGAPRMALGPQSRPMFDLRVHPEALVHDFLTGTRIPDEMGGGFLSLGVNCRRTDRELREARKAIAQAPGVDEDAVTLCPIRHAASEAYRIAALTHNDLARLRSIACLLRLHRDAIPRTAPTLRPWRRKPGDHRPHRPVRAVWRGGA